LRIPTLPLEYLVKVIIITSSGALSPGPLTASTIAAGSNEGWKSGFKISVGHMVVELPLVFLIAFGIATLLTTPIAEKVISFAGGTLLVILGVFMLKDVFKKELLTKGVWDLRAKLMKYRRRI